MARIVAFGEGMIEISGGLAGAGRVAFAGDVLNVAIAMARLGCAPQMLTALGQDSWSDELIAAWAAEGVDTALIARHPDRVPGVYGVTVDETGERSFTYWRSQSAARDLFALAGADALLARAAQADLLFLSGITLSLYDPAGRARIGDLAAAVRDRGGDVAFDGNYRPRGWADAAAARAAFEALAPHVSIALPTLEDEAALYPQAGRLEVIARWQAAGAREVVLKLGPEGALVAAGGHTELVATTVVRPVDTSGAGDAFDAGYLAAREAGAAPVAAARFAHRLAGETILHRGAIPPAAAVVCHRAELPGLGQATGD